MSSLDSRMNTMEDPIRIGYSNIPFTPPEQPSLFTFQSLTLFALNIFSLGIYPALQSGRTSITAQELTQNHQSLLKELEDLLARNEAIDADIKELVEQLAEGTTDQLEDRLESLKQRKLQINGSSTTSLAFQLTAMDKILTCIRFVGDLLANIATVGLYAVLRNRSIEYHVMCLQARLEVLQRKISDKRQSMVSHIECMNKVLSEHLTNKVQIKALALTEDGRERIRLVNEHTTATRELQRVTRVQLTLTATNERLSAQIREKTTELTDHKTRLQAVRVELDQKIRDADALRVTNRTLTNQVNTLTTQAATLTSDIQAQAAILRQAQARAAQAENQARNAAPQASGSSSVDQSRLGPIPPSYTIQEAGAVIRGAFEVQEDSDWRECDGTRTDDTPHSKKFNGRTLSDLVYVAFNEVMNEMLNLGEEPDSVGVPRIKFNRSIENYSKIKIAQVIYCRVVLLLLQGAKLYAPDCHGYVLKLNRHVIVGSSKPYRALTYKIDPANGRRISEERVFYSRIDEFTPTGENPPPNGICPVEVRWILNQLTEAEKNHLYTILTSRLIPESDPCLVASRQFLANPTNAPRARLIKLAAEMINDMAAVIGKKFNDVLTPLWGMHCTGDDLAVFVKPEDPDFAPGETFETAPAPSPQPRAPVAWDITPNLKYFTDTGNQFGGSQVLRNLILEQIEPYQWVFQQLTRDYVKSPMSDVQADTRIPSEVNDAIRFLKRQYHISHHVFPDGRVVNGTATSHGCLMSAIWASFNSSTMHLANESKYVQCLKNAMANYLEEPANAARFAPTIRTHLIQTYTKWHPAAPWKEHTKQPMTVKEYCEWLRRGCYETVNGSTCRSVNLDNHNELGEVELHICANLLGVQINVFELNKEIELNRLGLIVPKHSHSFGPDTAQYLALFTSGGSWYGLFPKLKSIEIPSGVDDDDGLTKFKNDLDRLIAYWDHCHRTNGL